MTYAIEARDLTKQFGKFLAVDHIDFSVERGEIFGFLGPNGAGKTTTQRMLTTLLTPTSGQSASRVMPSIRMLIRSSARWDWFLRNLMFIQS